MLERTRFNKIMKLEDSNLKLLKLVNMGLTLGLQGSEIQAKVKNEVNRLFDLGFRCKY